MVYYNCAVYHEINCPRFATTVVEYFIFLDDI